MSALNYLVAAATISFAVLLNASPIQAGEPAPTSVQIEFPIGDIKISYIESSEGMVLKADNRSVSVQARRLFFGDGKHAVAYTATNHGMQTPNGRVNKAALEIKDDTTITTTAENLHKWGKIRGAIYIKVPNLKVETAKD